MKLRLAPLMLSLSVSVIVLFGSWHLYQSYALEDPFRDKLAQVDGVVKSELDVSRERVIVHLTLEQDANYRQIVKQIEQDVQETMNSKELRLVIDNDSSEALDHWWSTQLFEIAEAMENKRYGDIPELLEQEQSSLPGMTFHTEMDQSDVYVKLVHGEYAKFIRLPRQPAILEVQGDE